MDTYALQYMDFRQGELIQNPNKPDFSFLFPTCLDMTKPSAKIHDYVPYSLGVISRTKIFSMTLHEFWKRYLIKKLN